MILKRLTLHHIRSYLDATIEFPTGTVLLSGDIGSGKSTILFAVEFALFGLRRDVSGASLLRNGADKGFVELTFTLDAKDITIKRTLKRGNSVTQDSGYIIDTRKKELTAVELKQAILQLLHYPQELLTKSKSLMYRYTVYTPQEEMKQILQGDAESRLDTLRKVFGIDKYQRVYQNAEIFLSQIKGKVKELSVFIVDRETKQLALQQQQEEVTRLEHTLAVLVPQVIVATEALAMKTQQLLVMEKSLERFRTVQQEIEMLQLRLHHTQQEMVAHQQQVESIHNSLLPLEKELTGKQLLKETIDLASQERTLAAAEKELFALRDTLQHTKTLQAQSEQLIQSMGTLLHCPVCQQEVTEAHKSFVITAEQKKIAGYLEQLQQASAKQEAQEKLIATLKKQVHQLQEQFHEHSLVQHKFTVLQEKQQELQRLSDLDKKLEQETTALTLQLQAVLTEKTTFQQTEAAYATLKQAAEKARQEERRLAIEQATLEGEIKHKKYLVTQLHTELQRKEKIAQQISSLKQLQVWVDELFMQVVRVIEKQIMMKVHAEFDGLFQHWFQILVDTDIITVALDEAFTPTIQQNGHDIAYEFLSGGEKTAAALAYRLALNQIINNMISLLQTRDLLILDEPTDGFSSEQLDRLRLILEELKIQQVIIVSHESKIESFVEHVIRIEKTNHISTVISQ